MGPGRVILLVAHAHDTVVRHRGPHVGRLVQPRNWARVRETAAEGIPWAADNDAFNGPWDSGRRARYVKMLNMVEGAPGCRFVSLPDVVGDARETARLFSDWWSALRDRGLPVALVAQDGIGELGVPWDRIEALFIGGTTEFKLGETARDLAAEAKRRGKWLHMGRVNSERRIRYAASLGCDSVDGTKYARFTDTWLERGISTVAAAHAQGTLEEA